MVRSPHDVKRLVLALGPRRAREDSPLGMRIETCCWWFVVVASVLSFRNNANIFLSTYATVVFSHLSLQPLFPLTRSQQCFTTAMIRSLDHFEHLELKLWHLLAVNSKLIENFEPSSEYSLQC